MRFSLHRKKLEKAGASARRGSRVDEPAAYHAEGTLYLSPDARFDYLLTLPEASGIGAKGELEEPSPYVGLEHIPRRSLALDAWETNDRTWLEQAFI